MNSFISLPKFGHSQWHYQLQTTRSNLSFRRDMERVEDLIDSDFALLHLMNTENKLKFSYDPLKFLLKSDLKKNKVYIWFYFILLKNWFYLTLLFT